jgi:predicted N-acyltransferase
MFRVDYRLDAPLSASFQALGDWLHNHAPSLITMPILGLGSPIADECQFGLLPGLRHEERRAVLEGLLGALSDHAAKTGVRVLVLKDVTDIDRVWAASALQSARFSAVPSLPVATLDIPFANLDEYLASLPSKMRQDLRRKRRQSASRVRIEYRAGLDGIQDEVVRLYMQTRSHRKASYDGFDELPGGYFREVMRGLGRRARLLLLWVDDTLAGFNLFTLERNRVVGRYLGLRYPLAREHNLYFVNWLAMVAYCIEHGYRTLQVGQTAYGLKVKLGCDLHRSWIYCRHTGLLRATAFRMLSSYAAFDRMDPDLQKLGDDARYADPPTELV